MSGTVSCAARRGPVLVGALVVALAVSTSGADAAENGGIVVGAIVLAPPEQRGAAPARSKGFIRRVPNALKPPRAVNPLPEIVVVLDGATPPEEDRQPPGQPVRYTIIGESFEVPLLPVVVGSVVEIRNAGRGTPRLFSPDQSDFVPPDPIGPRGERRTRKIDPPFRVFTLRDRESVHLTGSVVAFPHRYTALVDAEGKFTIKDVAPGLWKVRVWYRSGWAEAAEETVEVVAKKETKPVKLVLPAKLVIRPTR